MDDSTKRLVAMKRVKFDDRVEREIRMSLVLANLSDVPCPREFIFRSIILLRLVASIWLVARIDMYRCFDTAHSQQKKCLCDCRFALQTRFSHLLAYFAAEPDEDEGGSGQPGNASVSASRGTAQGEVLICGWYFRGTR